MSGATTELGLATATDSDDNADYLTISLANSLRTVDALYNNVTGHNHNGAHQGGPITTIPAGAIPDGAITSAKIADGTIATVDLADQSVTNAKLGADTARLNLLSNGGFEIWQRGNGPFATNAIYAADRWQLSMTLGSTISVSRQAGNSSEFAASCTYTKGAGTAGQLYQTIEGVKNLVGKTVTFAADVYCTVPSSARLFIWDSIGSQAFSAYHPGSSQWTRLTCTVTLSPSATQLHAYLQLDVDCVAGIDNASLVIGSQAANYAPLHPADDLARCLRYYERIGAASAGDFNFTGYQQNGSGVNVPVPFKVIKAVTPTMTKNGTWTTLNCSQPTVAPVFSTDIFSMTALASATSVIQFTNNAANANVTAEANP